MRKDFRSFSYCGERKQNRNWWLCLQKMLSSLWRAQDMHPFKSLICLGVFSQDSELSQFDQVWAFENPILYGLSKGFVEFFKYMPWSFQLNELIPVQGSTGFPFNYGLRLLHTMQSLVLCFCYVSQAVCYMWDEDDCTKLKKKKKKITSLVIEGEFDLVWNRIRTRWGEAVKLWPTRGLWFSAV